MSTGIKDFCLILDPELDYCENCDDHYGFVSVDSVWLWCVCSGYFSPSADPETTSKTL